MMTKKTLPAEWQCHSAILISWPHEGTDWAYMLDEVEQCYINMVRAISKVAKIIIVAPDASKVANTLKGFVDRSRYTIIEMPTNDTWARDFGMITTKGNNGKYETLDYKFNGWGLKFAACHDNLVNINLKKSGIINHEKAKYINRLGFVLEGGSIDIDENGTLLTTSECLLSPNRNGDLNESQIDDTLRQDLGATKVIWLTHGALEGDDTDSHIDTLARFVPGHKILYTSCDRSDDIHYEDLSLMAQELREATDNSDIPYEVIPLPIPESIYDSEGQRLPATYANFLIINNTIFLPIYGDDKYDQIAITTIKAAVPDYELVTIDCRALIQQHGSLHCATMQIPEEVVAVL